MSVVPIRTWSKIHDELEVTLQKFMVDYGTSPLIDRQVVIQIHQTVMSLFHKLSMCQKELLKQTATRHYKGLPWFVVVIDLIANVTGLGVSLLDDSDKSNNRWISVGLFTTSLIMSLIEDIFQWKKIASERKFMFASNMMHEHDIKIVALDRWLNRLGHHAEDINSMAGKSFFQILPLYMKERLMTQLDRSYFRPMVAPLIQRSMQPSGRITGSTIQDQFSVISDLENHWKGKNGIELFEDWIRLVDELKARFRVLKDLLEANQISKNEFGEHLLAIKNKIQLLDGCFACADDLFLKLNSKYYFHFACFPAQSLSLSIKMLLPISIILHFICSGLGIALLSANVIAPGLILACLGVSFARGKPLFWARQFRYAQERARIQTMIHQWKQWSLPIKYAWILIDEVKNSLSTTIPDDVAKMERDFWVIYEGICSMEEPVRGWISKTKLAAVLFRNVMNWKSDRLSPEFQARFAPLARSLCLEVTYQAPLRRVGSVHLEMGEV